WWYVPYQPMQAKGQPTLGSTAFRAPNPPFGATFTYHLESEIQASKAARREGERKLDEAGKDVPFPGWDQLRAEHLSSDPVVLLIVKTEGGEPVRSVPAECTAGLHRASWDLRLPPPDPVKLETPGFQPPWMPNPQGALVPPGRYSVELVYLSSNGSEVLAGPQLFEVRAVAAVEESSGLDRTQAFGRDAFDLARRVAGAGKRVDSARDRIRHLRAGMIATPAAADLLIRLDQIKGRLEDVALRLHGDPIREKLSEPASPSVRSIVERITVHAGNTTGAPTATQRLAIDSAAVAFDSIQNVLSDLIDNELANLTVDLDDAGGPWTPR
ncbi:MAG: hypothetical protein ACN4GZ_11485, partial [Acidimicrobiales bacterium]